jgi:hypothetical protein
MLSSRSIASKSLLAWLDPNTSIFGLDILTREGRFSEDQRFPQQSKSKGPVLDIPELTLLGEYRCNGK